MAYSQRPVLSATRARQGRFGKQIFWVLLFGTALAALGLFAAWTWKSGDLASANSNNGPSQSAAAFSAPDPGLVDRQNYQEGAPLAPQNGGNPQNPN